MAFAHGDDRCIEISPPKDAPEALALAYGLAIRNLTGGDERQFAGGLMWLRESGIWSPTFERIGERLLDGLVGEPTRRAHGPGFLATASELVDMQSALSLAILIGWDAYFVPSCGDMLAFVSHDGPVRLTARSGPIYESLVKSLDGASWEIRERRWQA